MTEPHPPPFDAKRWARVEALFHEASERPADERAVFLDEACDGDRELRASVERLLAADDAAEALVDRSLEDVALPLLEADAVATQAPAALDPGTRVGRYRVLELIGRGGMGSVYRAERADGAYERRVALKLAHAERLDEEAARRFRQERQILARLQHPGIATLLDGGVTDRGRPYFVIELIEGTALTELLRERRAGRAGSRPPRAAGDRRRRLRAPEPRHPP